MSYTLDHFRDDVDRNFVDAIETIEYRGDGTGDPVTVSAYIDVAEHQEEHGLITTMQTILVKRSDIADPKSGDELVARGKTCRVIHVPRNSDHATHVLHVMVGEEA